MWMVRRGQQRRKATTGVTWRGGRKHGGKHIALFSRWHPQRGRGQWLEEDKSPDKSKLPGDC